VDDNDDDDDVISRLKLANNCLLDVIASKVMCRLTTFRLSRMKKHRLMPRSSLRNTSMY